MNTRCIFHYKSGSYSGRIDDNYPRQWSKYVYSDTWTPINNSKDTYYTVSGWVYVEDVTTNGSLPNLAKLWIVTRKQGERGYPTGHISTSSTKEGTWEYLSKTVLIPADVKEINVRIENARLGKVWFDDVKIVKGNTSQTVIVEESNYYPFGLQHKGYNNVVSSNGNSVAQKFGYNGVEYEESLGLDLYEMDVRSYDPALGRFNGIDPVTHFSQGTSVAFDNNPIYFADPSGANSEWIPKVNEDGSVSYIAEEGDSAVTLAEQYTIGENLSPEEELVAAERITGTTGDTEIAEGTEVSGQSVANETGGPLLKYDIGSKQDTKQRFFDHFLFSRDYSTTAGKGSKAFLTSKYFDITNYLGSSVRGLANMKIGDKNFKVSFDIPIYRIASFDKYDKSWGYGNSAWSVYKGWSKYFNETGNVYLQQYHPSGQSQNRPIPFTVHNRNREVLEGRLSKKFPKYNYSSIRQKIKH